MKCGKTEGAFVEVEFAAAPSTASRSPSPTLRVGEEFLITPRP